MIARVWRGVTSPADAAAYERLLTSEILPGIAGRRIEGYRGAHLLRRDLDTEVEFLTILWFESMQAVAAFAGPDHEAAVVPPKARALLKRFDRRSAHYETLLAPPGAGPDGAPARGTFRLGGG
jgi:heme-degrading monooxygenase HmoA